jgi:hypothetical protein
MHNIHSVIALLRQRSRSPLVVFGKWALITSQHQTQCSAMGLGWPVFAGGWVVGAPLLSSRICSALWRQAHKSLERGRPIFLAWQSKCQCEQTYEHDPSFLHLVFAPDLHHGCCQPCRGGPRRQEAGMAPPLPNSAHGDQLISASITIAM